MDEEEIYVCQSCGHEGHPDEFGDTCPRCGVDLAQFDEDQA